jgi:sugar transferase (PEP-CTERM/EpsH1 system associated)
VLRLLRPAIAHTRNLGTIDLQWLACAARIPARVHGEHGWDAADTTGTNARSLRIRRLCRPPIHRFVAVSNNIANWLQQRVGVASSRITTIINGVDTEKFLPDGDQPADVPWRVDGIHRPLVFGTVGRLDPIKNQPALLRAFARVGREFPSQSFRLLIVGNGPLQQSLLKQAQELQIADRVWMSGARDDVAALLRVMDVFVLPSHNEGISNTLLEAMATGRAIIAANVGGNGELIRSGQDGLLYDPSNESFLCDLMRTYLQDDKLRASHGNNARRAAVERFSIGSMVDAYAQLYRGMLRF